MNPTIHNLAQGSAQWHAYRARHFNASETAAMLGISSYQSRAELLRTKATGLSPEVNAATQRRFDAGHEFEALARPWAEEIIGEDLYPITASREVEGLALSASYDGATMMEDAVFEHKSLNAALAESLSQGVIPEQYHPQLEQQLLVIGAQRALFMASSGDKDHALHTWYRSNPELRARLVAGWKQFALDLAAYVPPAAAVEVVGHTPETLPALRIEVTGMVTASNLADYKAHALAVFAGINRELETDQQFSDAEKVVKWCGDVEDRLIAAKQHALSQTESIDALFRTIDDISAEARCTRLELDKLVKARKEAVRGEIVAAGVAALREHVAKLNQRVGRVYMPAVPADFAGAIKGRRTVSSLQDAVDTELARAKIDASAIADRISRNLATLCELASCHTFLFSDEGQIVLKQPDDLTMLVKCRIAEHQQKEEARIEAETARIRAEELARIERNRAEKAKEEALAQASVAQPAIEAVTVPELVPVTFWDVALEAEIADAQFSSGQTLSPAASAMVVSLVAHLPAEASAPTLRLGEINNRLAPIALTAEGLASLGFAPVATDKNAKLYRAADLQRIGAALIRHLSHACEVQAA
ncbi:hypothetical protein [Polaromonas sp. CG9_12]|nr:hypothetical protein [Polaromonas sp. CG9_12]